MKCKLYLAGIVISLTFLLSDFNVNAQITFSDVAISSGINLTYGDGLFGGGVSAVDFNNDGLDDISLTTEFGDSVYFYLNNGAGFTKIAPSLIPNIEETKQILWVDYDNDNDKDLFVTSRLGSNRLYNNDGNLLLTDVTISSGLSALLNSMPTFGAAFVDMDNDSWLDLYITNRDLFGYANYLFKNQGDGTFIDITISAGVSDSTKLPFCATFFDMNNNNLQDMYIAIDKCAGGGNTMFKNNGNSTFTDLSASTLSNLCMDAMCVTIGDCDNDGFLDIYVTNTVNGPIGGMPGSALLKNNGNETFTEIATSAGVGFNEIGWGSNFLDYDNDGKLDIYVNGASQQYNSTPNKLYHNDGNNLFSYMQPNNSMLGDSALSYSNAIGDFNNDGFIDIIVNNEAPYKVQLWQNIIATGNWLKVCLKGIISNSDAIGAKVEIYCGGNFQMRMMHCGNGYLAQNSSTIHFGVDTCNAVDSIIVKWPSGIMDKYYSIPSNQKLVLSEGESNCSLLSPVSITVAKSNISCFAQNNGSISLTISGGNSPYDFLWDSNPVQTTAQISNLAPRYYNCIIKDNSDCIVEKDVEIREPTTLLNFFIPTNPSAPGMGDGAIDVLVSGGVAPYTYLWSTGGTAEDATGLTAGNYFVTIIDRNGCAGLLSITLID